jgi:NAD(P)H-hydrate epimerase
VDGLFGVGLARPLPPEIVPWTDHGGFVVSIDVPSGLDAASGEVPGTAFTADVTVTLHAPKTGLLIGSGPDHTGVLEIADIGLVGGIPELQWWTGADAAVPRRRRRAHKWTAGSVLVVGGAPGMVGAPVLAAGAALRSGAGAVSLVTPGGLPVQAPSALLRRRVGVADRFDPDDASTILEEGRRFDVLVLGPGLGDGMGEFVNALADAWQGPLILDADGLTAIDLGVVEHRTHATILTPHAGEFFRLTGDASGHEAAEELAAGTGAVVLLKGAPSFVVDRSATRVITSGGRELATIGTGDILSGMIAAFVARGLDPADAAASAAHWHGIAARSVAERRLLTADDLVDEIASVVPRV